MVFQINTRNKIMLQVLVSYLFSFLLSIGLYYLFVISNAPKESIISSNSLYNTLYFVLLILIETTILILLLKFLKKINIMKIIDVLITLFVIFGIVGFFIDSILICLAIATLIVIIKEIWKNYWFKNFIVFLVVAFFSAYIGYTLGILPVMLLLFIIAIYDYIAVFKTKHMIFLANNVVNNNTLFVMDYGCDKKVSKSIETIQENKSTEQKEIDPSKRNHLHLGTGDFALPLMAIMTLFANNIIFGIIAFIACLIGLELTLWLLFSKKHLALPAIPLQAICLLLVYGIYLIF